ncbi:MAG: flagellar hook capping protein [Lachnospiraceae bacterium]|nr:flagellar hook capping protein [Lachnospiraceae bacterium]
MALIQEIKNGQVVDNSTSSNDSTTKANNFDKDMFLQLLVAEMKYQDPLEPTTNTEYVSELASFTQIESTQNVQDKMDDIQASSYVGKYVIINTTDSSGEQQYVSGKVDFLEKTDDGYMVSVNDGLYKLEEIETVADETYYTAMMTTKTFEDAVTKLPNLQAVSLQDEEKISAVRSLYDSMDEYTKQFINSDSYSTLEALENRIAALKSEEETTE